MPNQILNQTKRVREERPSLHEGTEMGQFVRGETVRFSVLMGGQMVKKEK